jgi:hypothetical protein
MNLAGDPGRRKLLAPMAVAGGDPNAIVSVTDNGSGKSRYATDGPHGITGTPAIEVTGIADIPEYNVAQNVTATPTATTFDTDLDYGGDSVGGGTWALA